MGRVMPKIKLRNNTDYLNAHAGLVPIESVRTVEIEALVDTGATMLVIPENVRAALGIELEGTRRVRYANGQVAEIGWVTGVRLEILGREMSCDALVETAGTTVLVGQIPLEALDLVVDPKSRELRVNPASPDMPLLDLLLAS